MGRSLTPLYRVEFSKVYADGRPVAWTPCGWSVRRAGHPTDANLALYVETYEHSTCPDECNEHLGVTLIGHAEIVRQSTGKVVASYDAPLFRAL